MFVQTFSVAIELTCFSPSIVLTASSIFLATSVSISVGLAPGYTVRIVTYGMSIRGICSRPIFLQAFRPSRTSATSNAETAMGRRTDAFDKNMRRPLL